MATHDYIIDNADGATVRADINDALEAIVTNNSSGSEPTTTYAFMWWADTTNGLLKLRNAADSAWVTVADLATGLPNLDQAVVINESGADVDFRIESDTDANAFFLNGANGRIGIGTSSPDEKLHIFGGSAGSVTANAASQLVVETPGDAGINLLSPNTQDNWLMFGDPEDNFVGGLRYNHPSDYLGLYANNAERMRIASGGTVFIGKTAEVSTTPGWQFKPTGEAIVGRAANDTIFIWQNTNTGATVGSISITASATSYNTSSDYRLKEDWQPMSGSIDRLKNLNPVNFAWKADGSRVDGFLAHEAAEVVPEAVTGEKDAMRTEEYEVTPAVLDDDGNVVTEAVMGTREVPDYQGIDQAKLVPLLTAALQETVAKIEALETRIAALEA